MELSMYQRMLLQPLFSGLTTDELTHILALVHFDFQSYPRGEYLTNEYDKCSKLMYVLDGEFVAERYSNGEIFQVREYLTAPYILEPENLFGMNQRYNHSYLCETDCNTFSVSKDEFIKVMLNLQIVKFNLLNMLSAHIQRLTNIVQSPEETTVEQKIKRFLQSNCITTKGRKEFKIKMTELADYIQETRLNVSGVLKKWNDSGLIQHPGRGTIIIPELTSLLNAGT